MTEIVTKLTEAADKDAAYVLRKIADAEQHAKNAVEHQESAAAERELERAARSEAGARLIEVRAKFPDRAASGKQGFVVWLEDNGIPTTTAYRHMKDAGHTEEERTAEREKEATRKREARAKQYRKGRNVLMAEALGIGERQASDLRNNHRAWFDAYPAFFTDKATAQAFVTAVVAQFPIAIPPADRGELAPTAQQKLDRAIQRETDRLAGAFWTQVREQVQLELPEQRTVLREAQEKINVEIDIWTSRNSHMDSLMTQDEYRLILSCLHPDRVPEADKAKYGRAFDIMRKLGDRLTK